MIVVVVVMARGREGAQVARLQAQAVPWTTCEQFNARPTTDGPARCKAVTGDGGKR